MRYTNFARLAQLLMKFWERLDEIRDEYLAEYEKRCFTTMKHEFLRL